MAAFRDRFSRTDFFNIAYEDAFNPIAGRAARAAAVPGSGAPGLPATSTPDRAPFNPPPGRAARAAAVSGSGPSGLPGNYQPVESAWYIPGPTAIIDTYAATPSTTGTLVVDDPNHILAACEVPGDNDWFAVTLTAGVTYQFGQYAYARGAVGVQGSN